MYNRHDRAMDRYVTGNWGEDQFKHEPDERLFDENGDPEMCDGCGERPAVVVIEQPKMIDCLLCQECAKEKGFAKLFETEPY